MKDMLENTKNKRHVGNRLLRLLKLAGKAIIGLILLLFVAILLLHVPAVQKQLAHRLSTYLSDKLESRVEIQELRFSLNGNVTIEGLQVWDPESSSVISARKIEVTSDVLELLSGNFIFKEVSLEGVKGQVIQTQDGLNIQFILGAFLSSDIKDTTTRDVKLIFKKVTLEDIAFQFLNQVNGMTIDANIGELVSQDMEYSSQANRIKASHVDLVKGIITMVSDQPLDYIGQSDSINTSYVLIPDIDLGIDVEINEVKISESAFSFHKDQVTTTPKFDPSHIDVKDLQLNVSDILISGDTLEADIQTLAFLFPGFKLSKAGGEIRMSKNQLSLDRFFVASGDSEFSANVTTKYDPSAETQVDEPDVSIDAQGMIHPDDIDYFFSDDMVKQFSQWNTTEVKLAANYKKGNGDIETLQLKTSNSLLDASGYINDIFDLDRINWQDLKIHSSIGSDFNRLIVSIIGEVNIPNGIEISAISSGTLQKIALDGKINTKWGNVTAKGAVSPLANNIKVDLHLSGNDVLLGKWMDLPWLGPVDLSVDAKGVVGENSDAEFIGMINSIELFDKSIQNITFQSRLLQDSAMVNMIIKDPEYRSKIVSEISFAGPVVVTSNMQFDTFELGGLLNLDSTLTITGDLSSNIKTEQSSIEVNAVGSNLLIQKQSIDYALDTMTLSALTSPSESRIDYVADDGKVSLSSNFDLRELQDVVKTWSENILGHAQSIHDAERSRVLQFEIQLDTAVLLPLFGIEVEELSSIKMAGDWDEQKRTLAFSATSGRFKSYGVSLDTLQTDVAMHGDSITATMMSQNLFYNTFELGDLNVDVVTDGDTAVSKILLSKDSISYLQLGARILSTDTAVFIYPDTLFAYGKDYHFEHNHPVYISNGNVKFDQFQISQEDMQISIDGDMNAFDASFERVDLASLNDIFFADTLVVNSGYLSGIVTYIRDQELSVKAQVDSLVLYNSIPLSIDMSAEREQDKIPFQFLLSNASNKIDMSGQYFPKSEVLDASLLLDVNELEMFSFLATDILDEMKGGVKGEAKIDGTIDKPSIKGSLHLVDVEITTANPQFKFNVPDDVITFDGSSISFDNFRLYDEEQHPLIVTGSLKTSDFETYDYNLKINTDQYTLLNNPGTTKDQFSGLLAVAADITMKGDERDTDIEAEITILNTTNLTFLLANDEINLLQTEGIIEFVDPGQLLDSAELEQPANLYDSLITSLPDFNLNSTLIIEEGARLRVIINEQSGDFFEASGAAKLDMDYNRAGKLQLVGQYTIKEGVYRVSFYDLVKKNFQMVPGSTIKWIGSPETGELDIKAVYTVQSNSVGLIGHEVGENEMSIYKRALNYEVGINIEGTVEKPIISFSLDLPDEEKANFPALATKLNRLALPEFQSELNKQVFGLLVLGGFLPETSVADINQNLIATTAIANSVNSLLAGQLNRFAGQYIKGVNIDVGLQSYSDYSTPGGKTQTAVDFSVSKSILNDRLTFEVGGDFDINSDQSGGNKGDAYRGDVAIIYDLTGDGDIKLKLFNNESYDIIYQEIRNTGISLIFIREFNKGERRRVKEQ